MRKTFNVIADPGHAWLKVTPADLRDVGLTEGHFSPYSYRRENWRNGKTTLYLEEDCDAGIFCDAFERKYGFPIIQRVEHSNQQSRIRGYDSLRSDPALQRKIAA